MSNQDKPCEGCNDCQCGKGPEYRVRTEEQLRDALSRFCNNKSVMTVPVDQERDTDIILSDGIAELVELRGRVKELKDSLPFLEKLRQEHQDAANDTQSPFRADYHIRRETALRKIITAITGSSEATAPQEGEKNNG